MDAVPSAVAYALVQGLDQGGTGVGPGEPRAKRGGVPEAARRQGPTAQGGRD